MTHLNRSRFIVDLNGNWRDYSIEQPSLTPSGTVTINNETFALFYSSKTKEYFAIKTLGNEGNHFHKLDNRKIASAFGKLGRPPKIKGGRQCYVYLDKETIDKATLLGSGNLSEGIRNSFKLVEK